MESVSQVQVLDEAISISLRINAIKEGMNSYILSSPPPQLWVNSWADCVL